VLCLFMYSTCFKCENVKINTLRTSILKHLSRQAWPWPLTQLTTNQYRSCTNHKQPQYQIWRLLIKAFLSKWALFLVKAPETLTFDLIINRVHLMVMINLHAKYEDCGSKVFLSYWADKLFEVKVPVTLTFDLKINRGHLLILSNLH
jgi:hypothetical protein